MTILSVDLASRRYRDIGVAILLEVTTGRSRSVESGRATGLSARFCRLEEHGMKGEPDPDALAGALNDLAGMHGVSFIMLDGPQGWKDPDNGLEHSRVCENLLATPGKTGLPGSTKPGTWRRMAEFSVALFDRLHALGWPRLDGSGEEFPAAQRAIESFPTAAWRGLGLDPLPSKSKSESSTLGEWLETLTSRHPIEVERPPGHDELQALVASLAGLALARGDRSSYEAVGAPPVLIDGIWREGYILNTAAVRS